jgi:hypothetical protein
MQRTQVYATIYMHMVGMMLDTTNAARRDMTTQKCERANPNTVHIHTIFPVSATHSFTFMNENSPPSSTQRRPDWSRYFSTVLYITASHAALVFLATMISSALKGQNGVHSRKADERTALRRALGRL